jgi:phage baseplate assembly protein W
MSSSLDIVLRKSSTVSTVELYSDIDSNPITNSRNRAVNVNAIQQSLDNLFNTQKYERPFRPDYYSPVYDLIGELATEATAAAFIAIMYNKISQHEPRVIFDSANSSVEADTENNAYNVVVVFQVAGDLDVKYKYETRVYHIIT